MNPDHPLRKRIESLKDEDLLAILTGPAGTFPDYAVGWAKTEREIRRIDRVTFVEGSALFPGEKESTPQLLAWAFYALIGIYTTWAGLMSAGTPTPVRVVLLLVGLGCFWAMSKLSERPGRELWLFLTFLLPLVVGTIFPPFMDQLERLFESVSPHLSYILVGIGGSFQEWRSWRRRRQQQAALEAFLDDRDLPGSRHQAGTPTQESLA